MRSDPDVPRTSPNFQQAVQRLVDGAPPSTVDAVYSVQGIKLIERGVRVDQTLYNKLLAHQLSMPLEDVLMAQDSVNGKTLRAAAQALIAERPVLAHLLGDQQDVLLTLLEAIPLTPPVAFQLSVARDVHPSLLQSSLSTALLAGWLAARPGSMRFQIVMPMAAGLLQDLGMLHIDPVLLQPTGEITPEQRRQLWSHPLVSAVLLERHREYPAELVRAVREHHELLDGTGYPAHLSATRISPWGRIVSLAQVMTAMLRQGRTLAALRLSLLLRTNRHQFDGELADRVLNSLRGFQLPPSDKAGDATATDAPAGQGDPVAQLIAIDRLLADWPADLGHDPSLPTAQRDGMVAVSVQCDQMRRLLADVGASGEQLQMLGHAEQDSDLRNELAMIAQEMAWQVRAAARNASRRWGAAPDEPWPPRLMAWLQSTQQTLAAFPRG
jgi:HD-GYP domain-containing protein (c-di-GMP phosphodiesterase class II)